MTKPKFYFLSALLINYLCFSGSLVASTQRAQEFLDLGIQQYARGAYDSARSNFKEAAELAKQTKNEQLMANAYNNMANCYSNTGNSPEALNYYQQAISIAEKIGDKSRVAKCLKNIGAVYSEQKDFITALEYYDRSLKLAAMIPDSAIVADCFNNQGVVLEQQNNFDAASEKYEAALALYRRQANVDRISMCLNNLGVLYKNKGDFSSSLKNYAEAIALAEKQGDRFLMSANLNNIAGVHQLQGNHQEALIHYHKSLAIAQEIKATEIVIEVYDGLATTFESMKNYPEALRCRKMYEQLKSEFINTERSAQLAEMQTKYETSKKEAQIQSLEQQQKIHELEISAQGAEIQKRNFLLLGGLLLLVGLSMAFYFWLAKQKLKQKIDQDLAIHEMQERERMRIAKDIHDDLGSGLSKINFLSAVISQKVSDRPDVKASSETVAETAQKMVENMRDLIWALNPENTNLNSLMARIREFSADFIEDFPITLKINFPELAEDISLSKESHRAVFLVVKESLNNSIKHARASEISLEISVIEKLLIVSISDNGIGFKPENNFEGNGLRNMRNRISTLGGKIDFISSAQRGTEIKLSIPFFV